MSQVTGASNRDLADGWQGNGMSDWMSRHSRKHDRIDQRLANLAVSAPTTVAKLPGVQAGYRAFVTDSTVAASGNFAVAVSGGGANAVPVYFDGTVWRIG